MNLLVCLIMITLTACRGIRISKLWRQSSRLLSGAQIEIDPNFVSPPPDTGDICMSGLNGDQDILVRVVSCRELVQEVMLKNDLTPQAAKPLADLMVGSLMIGAGLKELETLQVSR